MSVGQITANEWLAELERLNALPNQNDGWTRQEISERLGLTIYRTRLFLKAGIKAKCIIAKPGMRANVIGTPTRTVLYSLSGPKGD